METSNYNLLELRCMKREFALQTREAFPDCRRNANFVPWYLEGSRPAPICR